MQTILNYFEAFKIRNVGILVLSMFLYSLTFYTTIFTLFLLNRGLNYWEIFFLESVLSAAIFLFEIPSGILADRFGRKKMIVFSVSLFAISTYIIALSHSFFGFIVESFLYGIGIAAMSGADSAIVYESLQSRGKSALSKYAFSLTHLTESFAMVISLPLGGFLASYSLNLPVYLTCLPMTIAAILTLFLKEVKMPEEASRIKNMAKTSLKAVIREYPSLVILQCLLSLVFGAVFSLHYLNQPLFVAYNIPVGYFGIIMLVINFLMSLIILLAPAIKEHLSERLIFFLTVLIPGLLFLGLSGGPSKIWGIGLLGFILIINSIRGPIYETFINDQIKENERATILSMISFVGSIVGMGFKPLIGVLADINLYTTFFVFGILLVIVSFGVAGVVRYKG